IILGAGPAGSMAAHQLARFGARILLIERKCFPRTKVCGSCLNMRALEAIKTLAVGDLGGTRLQELEVRYSGRRARLPLPGGLALSRSRFDAALARTAVTAGAVFLQETEGLIGPVEAQTRHVVLARKGRRTTVRARVVLIATGLGQVRFDGEEAVHSQPLTGSRFGAGCQIAMVPEMDREGTIFMAVGQRGYVGFVQLENGELNVAAAFEKSLLQTAGSPAAAASEILQDSGFGAVQELRVAGWRGTVPLSRRTYPLAGERFFVLGDASGYIEPFTGEGMAWALEAGLDVAPLAIRAVDRWDPSLTLAWTTLQKRRIARDQHLCRGVTSLLRRPWLTRVALEMASRMPAVARFMIDRVNTVSPTRQPS
ncbi:MAG: FAD-dependent monooxygenase, partial [Planctomycetaceae bacterium]|nr:FAD-dependent monooxygenase [Planctomycetaceae bacterium]